MTLMVNRNATGNKDITNIKEPKIMEFYKNYNFNISIY